jgi:CO/xanthine dehydrogenase Mo-binding subunit
MVDHPTDERSVRRRDARDKVTGRAMYAVDRTMHHVAHAAVVRSERAHAVIVEIDKAEALRWPGVIAVVTADDLRGIAGRFGHIIPDHPILAIDKVRYHGEPIALVIAESIHAAHDAAELVWVVYDELPVLTTSAEALVSSTRIHDVSYTDPTKGFLDVAPVEHGGNVAHSAELGWGDVESAMQSASVTVENTVRFPLTYAYAMETYNATADWQPGQLHVISTAQHPLMVRKELANIFELPLSAVRVEVPYIGGGYGSKSYTKLEPLASVGSWFVGRPVKVTTDVEGAINTTRADGATITVRSGFDDDGLIVGRDIEIELDSGAYADNSPLVLTKCVHRAFGPYRIPNLRVRGTAVYTNTSPASSYRGFGAPQGALAGELNMNIAADRLGIDPVDLRKRNLLGLGDTLLPGGRGLDADLAADLDLVAEALELHKRESEPGIRRARAVAVSASDAGASPISTAMVRMHSDGSVTLMTSSTEMGQGSRTVLAQIVARELDVRLDQIAVAQSDTLFTPYEWTTGASRTTTLTGLAIQAACRDLRDKLEVMAGQLEVSAGHDLRHAQILRAWFGADAGEVVGVGIIRKDGVTAMIPPFWEVGIVGVEVAIHEATAEVVVEHLVLIGDVGHAINPALVKGQDLGAATQGLGIALWEELIYEGQQLTNPNLVEYRVPRMRDMPCRITSLVVERADGVGPYGAKGSGEGAMNPVPAAVATAVGRAIGVWPQQLPLTPTRVWELLCAARDREGATRGDSDG